MHPDMEKSLKEFNKEVNDFAQKLVPEKVILFQKKLVLEALRRIVMKTPVATGRARGNWQVTIGSPAEAALITTDKDGAKTIQEGLAAIADLPAYSVVYISNNVDYIEFLEDGGPSGPSKKRTADGHSTQAPKGMVAITVEELRTMFQDSLKVTT